MIRVRLTIKHDPNDPTADLRRLSQIRHDLWAHSQVEIDPDSPLLSTHRDSERNAFFEFATEQLSEVERVLKDYGHSAVASIDISDEGPGAECIQCGKISNETVCSRCGFRDIEACPYCGKEVPRLSYRPISGDLFQCPECARRVRLELQDLLIDGDGRMPQPLILVNPAEHPVKT